MTVTVIIPFHRNLIHLSESVHAVRQSMPEAEVLIAADGAAEDCRPLAVATGAQVVVVPGPSGPAVARNRAAAVASGDVLAFVDADVVVAADALPGMCRLLAMQTGLDGVFGAYDLSPSERNFISQYKNLSHAYVHEVGDTRASTFWAGLGALRTEAFRAVGGFDERFTRPSIEDIELGYRLVAAGYSLRLDATFRGRHLKRWTLARTIATDIRARGIPWTQLIHRSRALSNDLNTTIRLRLSVVFTVGLVASLALAAVERWAAIVAAFLLAAVIGLNISYYRWFAQKRGVLFALQAIPVHLVHHLCNGISFVAGTALHVAGRCGVMLPGALPTTVWAPPSNAAQTPPPLQPST